MKDSRLPAKNRHFTVHALCWILYISYEQSAIFLAGGKPGRLIINLFYYGCNIGLFYLQQYLLGKTAGRRAPEYAAAAGFTLLEIVLFLILKSVGNYLFFSHAPSARMLVTAGISDLHRSLYFVGMSTLIWSALHISKFRQQAAMAEKAQLTAARDKARMEVRLAEAESAYCQHRLNPHLLLNTLNFIYNAVHEQSAEASRGVLLLADIFRFSLKPAGEQGKVALKEETVQIANLVEINRLRFSGGLFVRLDMGGPLEDFRVIPLILLTLAENLFKHGVVNDPAFPAALILTVNETGLLAFTSRNYKRRPAPPSEGRLGLNTIRVRLEQAYRERYTLGVRETDQEFQLQLTLQL